MSTTILNVLGNVTNGTKTTQMMRDKDPDLEKGEVQSAVANSRSRPTSSVTSATTEPEKRTNSITSVGSRVEVEDRSKTVIEVEVEAGSSDAPATVTSTESCSGWPSGETRVGNSRTKGTKPRPSGGRSTRWKTVGRLLRRLVFAMILIACLAAGLAFLTIYQGPMFLVQLLVLIAVAYFVAGGRLRWFYVAAKTAPRDVRALCRYAKLLWAIRVHGTKNRSVVDVFRQHVARQPNKICFICEDQEWTFQQVEDFSNKIATLFKTHGYRKGDVVALLLENRPEFIAIWLGLSKLGVITSLINTNLRKTSLLHSIHVANCQALIYGAEFTDAVSDIASSLSAKLSFYRFGDAPNSASSIIKAKDLIGMLADVPAVAPIIQEKSGYNDKLLYIYTSGTTGLPKAAIITSSRFMFIAFGIYYVGGIRRTDTIYTPLPLYHTAGGVMAIGSALLQGCTVVIRKKFSASAYINDCIKYKCTAAQYIGEMCRYILAVPAKPEDKQHNLRLIFGNGLRPQIWTEFVERFNIPLVVEFYGATEGNANILNIDNTVGAIGFMSRIIPSLYPISIIKVNAEGEPIRNAKGLCQVCGPDEPGVFIGKIIPNNPTRAFLGYVDEKASEKKIVYDVFTKGDSAFLSGDILVADELGYLYFKDRTGDTFRWKGENVSTSEIEGIVSNITNYRDCMVYGVEIRGAEGRAGMAAIYDENSSLDISQLTNSIQEQLPAYARPQFIRILSQIDLTGTFKLKKKDIQNEGYDPRRIRDKLYYLNGKSGYQELTPEVYDQILEGKIRF